jgi:DNA-binding winged helix-turn-helix (wHTH) protein
MTPSPPAPSSQPEPAAQSTRVVRFGVFEVDLRTAELRKQGVRIRLSGQSFHVLEALLLRPGELVTREELKQKLWPSDTFGDFEHGLNAAVNRVREALGDSTDTPRFVETLPRRGYRFIAPVEPLAGRTDAATPEAAPASQPPLRAQPRISVPDARTANAGKRKRTMSVGLFALAALFAILLGTLYVMHRNGKARPEISQDVRISPLTALPGKEMWPSLSPDGKQVVFAWDGGRSAAKSTFDLYKKVIGAEHIEQLTHNPAEVMVPAWSPDGSTIAFLRANGLQKEIIAMSVLGGPQRKLDDFTNDYFYAEVLTLSWSPDSEQLVYGVKSDLRLLTVTTGETRTIASPPQCKRVGLPVFSPDGHWIAFLCAAAGGTFDIYRVSHGW